MERFKHISGVHLILLREGKILLMRRANTGFADGQYNVPAGHIDGNETIREAAAREALEEARVVIRPEDLHVVHVTHRYKPDGERVDFYLTADAWLGEPSIGEPEQCDDLGWFDFNALPENTVAYIRFALEKFKAGELFSEFDWEKRLKIN